MDLEQEQMQSLGLFGIIKESVKIIFSWRKIFTQITLSLILPISLIFLAHIKASNIISTKILHYVQLLDFVFEGTENYSRIKASDWIIFFLFKILYFTLLLILSLLAISAVVYAIACAHTARQLNFKKVMSVVPKVWKRVALTSLSAYLAFFLYNGVTILTLYLSVEFFRDTPHQLWTFIAILIVYPIGFVYLTTIWQLASVVSVLEDSFGFRAVIKSKNLLKGKMWISLFISVLLISSVLGIQFMFDTLVANGRLGVLVRVGLGILCLLLLLMLFLFCLVIQTVLYFVCKSYHHEYINKSVLSNHIGSYLGDYVSLNNKAVQLQQCHI